MIKTFGLLQYVPEACPQMLFPALYVLAKANCELTFVQITKMLSILSSTLTSTNSSTHIKLGKELFILVRKSLVDAVKKNQKKCVYYWKNNYHTQLGKRRKN